MACSDPHDPPRDKESPPQLRLRIAGVLFTVFFTVFPVIIVVLVVVSFLLIGGYCKCSTEHSASDARELAKLRR